MPAKWQRWMPFHIDSFYGSPWVQAMHPAAQAGYLKLLAAQWHSDDCTLPADDEDLEILSGLGGRWDLWKEHSKAILRQFSRLEDGRLQNAVCFKEWTEAKRVFEARQKGGKGGTPETVIKDPPKTLPTVIEDSSKQADTQTQTNTDTHTDTEEQKNSPEPSSEPPVVFLELPAVGPIPKFAVSEELVATCEGLYPAVNVRQEIRNIRGWLDGNPTRRKTHRGMPKFIHAWMSRTQDGGKYGTQPVSTGGSGPSSPATARVASGVNAFRRAAEQFGSGRALGADGADGGSVSPPGHGGGSGELPLRLRAPDGQARVTGSQDSTAQFAN